MSATVFLRRQLGAMRPADAASEEALAAIPQGAIVRAEITRPRNLDFHRKFFALLALLFRHQDTYPTLRAFRAAVTVALGHSETIKLPDGRTIVVPESIAFAAMDAAEFDAFMARFFELAETRIIPGAARADLEREWNEIMAGREAVL